MVFQEEVNRRHPAQVLTAVADRRITAIVAASSGNLVEWFDFYVYAFSAIYFAPAFFPSADPTAQLLAGVVHARAGGVPRALAPPPDGDEDRKSVV